MRKLFRVIKEKWTTWAMAHPKLINQRNGIIVACVLIALILFCPISRDDLHDGGSVEYRALTYSVVRWEFFEGTRAPNPEHKITKVSFYPVPVCWTRSVWERQGDAAEKLGCFTYHVEQKMNGTKLVNVYTKTVNGYKTNSVMYIAVDKTSEEIDNIRDGTFITLDDVRKARQMMDRGAYRMDRNVDDVAKSLYPDGWETTTYFVRVNDDIPNSDFDVSDFPDFTEELIPVKEIRPNPATSRYKTYVVDLRTGKLIEGYAIWLSW